MQARHERQRSTCLTTSAVAGPVVLQHVLDQIDAAARGIELVAEQHIGRAGRGAEAAMHAGAQDLVGFRDVGIGELREGEIGLHLNARPHPSGIENALRIETVLDPFGQCRNALRLAAGTRRWRRGSTAGARTSVACPPSVATACRNGSPPASSAVRHQDPDQVRRPSRRTSARPARSSPIIQSPCRARSRRARAAARDCRRWRRRAQRRECRARARANAARRASPRRRTA